MSPRTQALLRVAPAIALGVLTIAGGAYALANHGSEFSALDGAPRAEFEYPTLGTVRDKEFMDSFDTYMDQRLPARDTMLEAHARFVRLVLRDPVVNDVYLEGPDGQLLEKPHTLHVRESLADEAASLVRAAGDATVLFAYAPRKEEVYADALPAAWEQNYPQAHDAIIGALGEAGEVVDLTALVAGDGPDTAAFFRTDHHWASATAKRAADAVADQLIAEGVPLGSDHRPYVEHTADLPFFGSTGRDVTAGGTAPDEFRYLAPEGGFRATMCLDSDCGLPTFDEALLDAPGKYSNRYLAFIGGDNGLVTITNDSPEARGTAVLLKDSYGNAFATYLAERVSTLYVIDERHYTGVPLDVFMAQAEPDAVVVLHNPVSLLSTSFESSVWTRRSDDPAVEPRVIGDTIIASDGLVLQSAPDQALDPTIADDARTLADAVSATGTPQFWFYAPRKEQVFADRMPEGTPNPVAENSAALLGYLEAAVPIRDLSPVLSAPGARDANFYRTDHHWTAEGARLAAEAIVRSLEAAGVPIGSDDRAWHRERGPYPFYGAEVIELPNDVDVIPDEMTYDVPDGGFRARICAGDDCSGPVIIERYLNLAAADTNRYRAFVGGTFDVQHLHNDDPSARGVVVMLADSYGGPVTVRLAERFTDLYVIDERKWDGGPLGAFIDSVDADAVVVLHNPVSVLSQAFNRDVWRDAGD